MPNIIEQQDLLKGLPDNRLALLMQQPSGDIPPFLVAAEAQRRQSIRQQFAGDGNKESVVDTLTKQMANVPQNVQAPMQTPPQMPPPQAGIAALEPQQMAAGGEVRRYAPGGYVKPTVASLSGSYYTDPLSAADPGAGGEFDTSGITRFFTDTVPSYLTDGLQNLKNSPFPRWETEQEAKDRWNREHGELPEGENAADIEAQKRRLAMPDTYKPAIDPGKNDTSPTNKAKDAYKYQALPKEFRQRIEDLYATQEPTGMENAQAWFDMSAQFLDPSKTTMQSIAGAGQAYTQARAAQKADQRAADRERERALLEYDINAFTDKRDYEQQLASAKIAAEQKMSERMTPTAGNVMDFYSAQIKALTGEMKTIDEDMTMDPDQKVAAKKELQRQIDQYAQQAATLMHGAGYGSGTVISLDDLRKSVSGQ